MQTHSLHPDIQAVLDGRSQWCVITQDCLQVLPLIPAGSVGAVVTDPPYGMSYQSARRIDKGDRFDRIANDEAPFVWFLADAARVIVPGGLSLCFCRWDSAEAFRLAIGWSGLSVASQLVWDRVGHGMGDLIGCPAPQHDTIWFAVKGRYKFHGVRPKSIVRHQRIGGDALLHPNEKPVELLEELVDSYVPPSAIVLDPFAGSGSTGVAAIQTGRRFIGIEIDEKYAEIARRRIADAAPLFVPPEQEEPKLFGGES